MKSPSCSACRLAISSPVLVGRVSGSHRVFLVIPGSGLLTILQEAAIAHRVGRSLRVVLGSGPSGTPKQRGERKCGQTQTAEKSAGGRKTAGVGSDTAHARSTFELNDHKGSRSASS